MSNQTIYIDSNKSPRTSLIRSLDTTTPAQMLDVVNGDVLSLDIRFTDANIPVTGGVTVVTASIGSYSSGPYVSSTNWFVSASWGLTGSMAISSSALNTALGSNENIQATFSVRVTDKLQQTTKTYLFTPIVIWKNIV